MEIRERHRSLLLSALTLFFMLFTLAGASWAFSITGTVTNDSGKTGRVYIAVQNQYGGDTGLGVSIPSPGPEGAQYTVRGVRPGEYIVSAFMDVQGTGTTHAGDPAGGSNPVSVYNSNVTGADIQLALPDPPATVQDLFPEEGDKLRIGMVVPGPGAVLVGFDPPGNGNGLEIADAYTIYWNTQLPVGPANKVGSRTFKARDDGMGIINLSNGQTLYFAVTGTVNGAESAAATYADKDTGTPIQVTTGPIASNPPFTHTVSGTVTIPVTITPAGPLYVAVVSDSDGFFITKVNAPSNQSPNPFSVTGVSNGNYRVYALIDQDNNGEIRDGDYMVGDQQAPAISVAGGDVSGVGITLNNNEVEAGVATSHWLNRAGEGGYGLAFRVRSAFKRPVNVAVRAGTGLPETVDLAMRDGGEFSHWVDDVARPTPVTQTYDLDITYSDDSSVTMPVAVTAVLDSFPVPVSPQGKISETSPTFSWNPPAFPPAGGYSYSLSLRGETDNLWWNPERFPSGQTSVLFNSDGEASSSALSGNAPYVWELAVSDLNGNEARKETAFFLGGSISGTVTDGVNGAAGISVQLYDINGQNLWGRAVKTGQDGSYVIGGLPSGDYRVCFYPGETGYISQCYNNQTSDPYQAGNIPVASPDDTPNINAVLVQGATITGTVTASGGGALAGVSVELRDANGDWVYGSNQAQTDGNGSYTLSGLAAGSYKLYFNGSSAGYIGQWYDGKADSSSADTIILASGQTRTANAALAQGGRITGTVTDEGTGAVIQGVQVQIYDQNWNWLPNIQAPTTGADGTYTIGGLPTGDYKVCFSSGSTNYIGECYDNVPYYQWDAPTVAVTAPNPTVANAALARGGTISGRVTNGTGGIQWVNVQLLDAGGNWVPNTPGASTDSNGNYTLVGVPASPAGGYKVYFDGWYTGYIGRWYDGGTGTADIGSAQSLTIAAGETKNNIGATLPLGASISGRVTDAANPTQGISGINVQIYDGNGSWIPNIWGANTDGSGNYSIGGLTDGSYKICFNSGSTSYLGKCYDNLSLDPANATTITITGGGNATGKDASLTLGATISGRVTFNNAGVTNVSVELRDTSGNWVPSVQQGNTSASGDYTIRAIPAGTYKLYFNTGGAGYVNQWYDNKYILEQATQIILNNGGIRSNVNAALAQAGAITGQVRNASNQPLNWISVQLWDTNNNQVSSTFTDSNGNYTFGNLPGGAYKLRIDGSNYGYESKWYLNSANMAGGTAITVTPPNTATAAVVTLARFFNLSVYGMMSGGFGAITDNLGKINCGAQCSDNYPEGTVVTLTAVPDANSVFTGWSGACSGTGTCQVTMDQVRNATAIFEPRPFTLGIVKAGSGGGTVSDSYLRISCGSDCGDSYNAGTVVTLYATPDPNSVFAGWSGSCSGTGNCTVTLDGNKSVTATFNDTSTVKKNGIGYATLLAAYNEALNGETILARSVDLNENLTLNRNIAVTLKGGYNSDFTANTGSTTLHGILTIGTGALTIDKITIY